MPPVFGRARPDPHPYDTAVASLLKHREACFRAIAVNVRHDLRVSPQRARVFHDAVVKATQGQAPSNPAGLERAMIDYEMERVRYRPDPDFIDPKINRNNLLGSGLVNCLDGQDRLVRALVLNGLGSIYGWAKEQPAWANSFGLFPADCSDDGAILDWLDNEIGNRSKGGRRQFVKDTLDALAAYQATPNHYHPAWATRLCDFEACVDLGRYQKEGEDWRPGRAKERPEGGRRSLQVLGMRRTKPCWVILLTYRVEHVLKNGPIARPTQLDAGWNSRHFPSPRMTSFGHPMDLLASNKVAAAPLLHEYIHMQVEHGETHWNDPHCGLLHRNNSGVIRRIHEQPFSHFGRPKEEYGKSKICKWMPDPVGRPDPP